MEKICEFQGLSFVGSCEIHTVQLKSSTYHQACSSDDILKTNVANTNERRHKYKFDLSKYDTDANNTAQLFSSNLSRLISEADLQNTDILRLDLKFDFKGISFERLYPSIRVLDALLVQKNKSSNHYSYKGLIDPGERSIGFKNSNALGVQFYSKPLQKVNTDVEARLEFQFGGLHYKNIENDIMSLWEELVNALSEAVTKEIFEDTEEMMNSHLIKRLKTDDPFARIDETNRSRKNYIYENKLYIISRRQLIDLLDRLHISHPEETADNMLRKKRADPEFCGFDYTESGGKIIYRDLLLFTLRDIKRLSRSIVKLAAGFFFGPCPSASETEIIEKALKLFKVRGDGENDDLFKVKDLH
ncbi:MAG: hypothetical protein IK990_16650 [Ruminiclostridium sp.]|nr:hypothetical protein [Ruminiclostridium sp.]